METYRRLLRLGARGLSLLALVILVLIEIWMIRTNGKQWISNFHTVTIFTQGTGVVSPSDQTVELEDFLPLVWIVLLLALGLVGVRATWRSHPKPVLAAGLTLTALAILTVWSIGLLLAPAACLLLTAAALTLSGKDLTDRLKSHAQ